MAPRKNIRDILKRINYLHEAGLAAEDEGNYSLATKYFSEATEFSETNNKVQWARHCRMHWGTMLMKLNKKKQALLVLAPLLDINNLNELTSKHYKTEIHGASFQEEVLIAFVAYISIAIELPAKLASINDLIKDLKRQLNELQNVKPETKDVLIDAIKYTIPRQIFVRRGMDNEYFKITQKAYQANKNLDNLICLCDATVQIKDWELANLYLEQLKAFDCEDQDRRKKQEEIFSIQSLMARIKGLKEDALEQAYYANNYTEESPELISRVRNYRNLVEIQLSLGKNDTVQDKLITILKFRNSEVGNNRYRAWRLLGDYHHSQARYFSGLLPIDFDYCEPAGCRIITAVSAAHSKQARIAIQRAKKAYEQAFIIGKWIDEQLNCYFRQKTINDRLEILSFLDYPSQNTTAK